MAWFCLGYASIGELVQMRFSERLHGPLHHCELDALHIAE